MRARSIITTIAALSIGCSALIGVKEIYVDENGGDGGLPDGAVVGPDGQVILPDGQVPGDGSTNCVADLQTDNKNCGRCGRDCLGAACKAGMCEPIALASQLTNPTGLFLTATSVFITAGPEDTGKILEIPKAGGAPRNVITAGQNLPWGLFIDGTTLYWADSDYPNNGTDRHGGVWKCTLPACANPTLVIAANNPTNPVFSNGFIYIPENNNSQVIKVAPTGANPLPLHVGSPGPLYVAADKTHAYSTSRTTYLYRQLLDGGQEEELGPQSPGNISVPGDIKLDDDRFYYQYCDTDTADGGHVVSLPKGNPAAQRIEYGRGNTMPRGLALDATYIYWTNWGTETAGLSNADGDVRACPKTGCPASGPIILASGFARPYHIAVDDSGVYFNVWTNYNQGTGSVQKVAKP